MKKESVVIYPIVKEILHGNLSIAALESASKQESLVIFFDRANEIKYRTEIFNEVFIDDAWRKQKGFVSFALGIMIENYSPKTSN